MATAPAATRAAVSRAEARSSTSRASVKPYFCMPGRSACPGRGLVRRLLGDARGRGHLLLPLRPFGIADLDGNRRAQGAAVADTAEQGQLVLLEAHPRSPAEPEAAPGQLGLDLLGRDRKPAGQALDHHDEALAMGLAGGQEAQHGAEPSGTGPGAMREGGGDQPRTGRER